MSEQRPPIVLAYMDIVLLIVAAPIMLLLGVSAVGYGVAAGAWIVFRILGVGVEHYATATQDANRQIGVRMGYMLGRLFTLAIIVILLRKSDGQDAGLAALAVIVFAFTAQLFTSALSRSRSAMNRRPPAGTSSRSR
jgi:hypothetical protein